jgi:hypothetical protein
MTTSYTIGSNVAIGLYQYEPFSYTWTYPGATQVTAEASTTISPFVDVSDPSSIVFRSTTGAVTTTSNESLTIRALDASGVLATSSNTVTVGRARFVDDVSASLTGRQFTFYKNEPIAPVVFSSFFPLAGPPLPTPTLPVGLGFVSNAPARYTLTGTPVLQVPSSNYNIIGSNPPKYIPSCLVTIAVNGERMRVDLSGTGVVSLMQPGVDISSQVITAQCPPYPRATNAGNIRYSWTPLPGGLEFADVSGVSVGSSPYTPPWWDPSATLVLRGTPTVAGAKEFADLGISQATVLVTATRTTPSPFVVASREIPVSFAETVLFTSLAPSFQFYTGVALDSNASFVEAQTYFTSSNVPITSITAPGGLPTGLSLNFVAGTGRAYLTGTPTVAGTGTYTLRATNANLKTRDVSASISVLNDSISMVGPVDVCSIFILSRPVSNALTGYYSAPLSWTATTASGLPVTFDAPALTGTEVSLAVSGNVATLAGIPASVRTLRNLRVTASAVGSTATNFVDTSFAIVNDVFAFSTDPSSIPVLEENVPVPAVRVLATTLSGRTVTSYSSSNLPSGVKITNFGVLTGTPTTGDSGTFTVVASTGSAVGSNVYSYTIVPDSILFLVNPRVSVYAPLQSVSIPIETLTFTGTSASNYMCTLDPSYGLTLNPTSGLLSGTLASTIPQGPHPFSVTATVGTHIGTLPATFMRSLDEITISFDTKTTGGPVITSPLQRSLTAYQYVRISPIQFTATGTGTIRYYLRTTDLPAGLVFDSLTATVSGKLVNQGTQSFVVYAEDDVGVTAVPISITTIFPVIVRDGVTTASAYTSLLRQYTAVNGARNAENRVVYPAESQTIGEFARPYPPDETTQTVDPKCYSTSNCP